MLSSALPSIFFTLAAYAAIQSVFGASMYASSARIVTAWNAAPLSWLVSTTMPSLRSGTRVRRETMPGQPPVCQTSLCPR